jgi:hypothetical protein
VLVTYLLFICTHGYPHFRIAHFKAPKEDGGIARLAAFGWGPDIRPHRLRIQPEPSRLA